MSSTKPCTCIENRVLHEREAVLLLTPARVLFVFARDCPTHGVVFADQHESVNPAEATVNELVDIDA